MKFKVWDSEEKCFITDHESCWINQNGELIDGSRGNLYPPRFQIIYSTGKTDKNGVELFDGDIGTPEFSDIKFVIVIKSWGTTFKCISDNGYYPLISFLPSRMKSNTLRFIKTGSKYEGAAE